MDKNLISNTPTGMSTVPPCSFCKKPHKKSEHYVNCQSCGPIFYSCLQRDKKYNGVTITIPSQIQTLVDFREDFTFICTRCDTNSPPLVVQLIKQNCITWDEVTSKVYMCEPYIMSAIWQFCKDNAISIDCYAFNVSENSPVGQSSVDKVNDSGSVTSEKPKLPKSPVSVIPKADTSSGELHPNLEVRDKQVVFPEQSVSNIVPSQAVSSIPNTEPMKMMIQMMNTMWDRIEKKEDRDRKEREIKEERERQERKEERDQLFTLINNLKEMNKTDSINTGCSSQDAPQCKVAKLPKLEINPFSGDILTWKGFWDSFLTNVHNRQDLSEVTKFGYLKGYLKGDAVKAIDGLPETTENYSIAVNILKHRYGDIDKTVLFHQEAMKNIPKVQTPFFKPLRNFSDEFLKNYRGICALYDNNTEFVDVRFAMLFPDLFQKLPFTSQSQMIAIDEQCTKKLSVFCSCLEKIVKSSELMNPMAESNKRENVGSYAKTNNQNSRFQSHTSQPTVSMIAAKTVKRCTFCGQTTHFSDQCFKFPTVESRKKKLLESSSSKAYCHLCLSLKHKYTQCPFSGKKRCFYCQKDHHRSLCYSQFAKPKSKAMNGGTGNLSTDQSNTSEKEKDKITSVQLSLLAGANPITINKRFRKPPKVPMQYVKCFVRNPETQVQLQVNVIVDTGCKYTYIREEVANSLNLCVQSTQNINVSTFGTSEVLNIPSGLVDIDLQLADGNFFSLSSYTVSEISSQIQLDSIPLSESDKQIVCKLCTLEQISEKPREVKIDVLLGQNYWGFLLKESNQLTQLSKSGIILMNTKLGWLPCSMSQTLTESSVEHTCLALKATNIVENEENTLSKVENLWRLDAIGVNDHQLSDDDIQAQKYFEDTVSMRNGRIYVSWPFKVDNPELPDNYQIAYRRLVSLVKSLSKKSEEIQNKYRENFEEQLKKGIIEKIDCHTNDGTLKHYIPHHGVYTPHKNTTKLRVVFDASAKDGKQLSLNECLLRGPVLLDDLCGLLIRFRTKEIVLLSDIEKAFLQIALYPKDREVTRFLWLKDPTNLSVENNIQLYRFCRVPFGIITSPYLLGASVRWLLTQFDTLVAKNIKENIYVDNVVTGVNTVEDAKEFYKLAKEHFYSGNMNLREWTSNSKEFLESIPEVDKVTADTVKVLGVPWNLKNDTLSITVPPQESLLKCQSKRDILKQLASIFDPLGYVSCFTVRAKIFLQSLWQERLDWDAMLSENQKKVWENISISLKDIENVQFPRLCKITQETKCSLVCFVDASKEAYSALVYLVVENESETESYLTFAKSRVVPKKGLSIPRAELMATVLGTRLLKFVEDQLRLPIQKKVLFSDSCCVLYWVQNSKCLKIFVENRIREIRKQENIEFRYIHTSENPADFNTKSQLSQKFDWKTWFKGPTWVVKPDKSWPTWDQNFHDAQTKKDIESECKNKSILSGGVNNVQNVVMLTNSKVTDSPAVKYKVQQLIDLQAFSSITKVFRITAYVLRFISALKRKVGKAQKFCSKSLDLEGVEVQRAKLVWELSIQSETFTDRKNSNNLIYQLGLYTDSEGLLRCRGRIGNADLTENQKFPKLLPSHHRFTELVILAYHEKTFHSGVEHTLAALRSEYWVLQGRSTVKRILKRLCQVCKRYFASHYYYPLAPDLPKTRVTLNSAFSHIGVDVFGPYWYKSKRNQEKRKKVWICIFVCMQIRAIHLELLSDTSAENISLAFRRFIARRGKPHTVLSDNATYFILTQKLFANQGIEWKTNPVIAPWFGGMYERLIGLVKMSLRKVIGQNCLTLSQFETLLVEVESVVNSRPLTHIGDSLDILSPKHFLTLNYKPDTLFTEYSKNLDYKHGRISTRKQLDTLFRTGQRFIENFWEIWQKFYLLSLRERHILDNRKVLTKKRGKYVPNVGDVVIIKSETLPKNLWKLGLITETHRGKDKEYRTCTVKTKNSTAIHAIRNLFPLEINSSE